MQRYYSTNGESPDVTLKEAVMTALPKDKGLYVPEDIPQLPASFFKEIDDFSHEEIAFKIASAIIQDEIPASILQEIIKDSINFEAPLVQLSDKISVLELFHGPTLAFKDFGARFMARLMAYFNRGSDRTLHILVATSGDTGSAVAQGFLGVPGIEVHILYPSGMVSHIQEKQLTTMGQNIRALEVKGTFDDCQALVKSAFIDGPTNAALKLTSANSINIARLIPQIFYYYFAYAQLEDRSKRIVISVPSGNFGNLTAGLMGKMMGLPVERFIAATNVNDIVPKFLLTGEYRAKASRQTLSSAMDVGNPSNFARLMDLYDGDVDLLYEDVWGMGFSDAETVLAMQNIYATYRYMPDPHGAVAYLGLQHYFMEHDSKDTVGIFLETAHPSKFVATVTKVLDRDPDIPECLVSAIQKKKHSLVINNDFAEFKQYLLALEGN